MQNPIKNEITALLVRHAGDDAALVEALYDLINPATLDQKERIVELEMIQQGVKHEVYVHEDLEAGLRYL